MTEPATIDIDTDKACIRCGVMGATPRGICLECIAEELKDAAIGRRTREQAKAEWRRMPEVETIVDELIAKHHLHLSGAQIVVLGKPKAGRRLGKVNVAKAKRATEAVNALLRDKIGEVHYLIEIGLDAWDTYSPSDRHKIIDHELMHCSGRDEDSERWGLVGHDIETFAEEVRRHGAWSPELRSFCATVKQLELPGLAK